VLVASLVACSRSAEPETHLVECDEAIARFDELGVAGFQAFNLGPVTMAGALDPREADINLSDGLNPIKFPTTIFGPEAVTLRVIDGVGGTARLIYGQTDFQRLDTAKTLDDVGHEKVTFEPCLGVRYTQFAGGFVVDAPVCIKLEVEQQGREPIRKELELAGGSCI